MARTLEMVYTVHRRSWIPEHNRPLVWFEVMAGHNPRDYQAENYSSAQRRESHKAYKRIQALADNEWLAIE